MSPIARRIIEEKTLNHVFTRTKKTHPLCFLPLFTPQKSFVQKNKLPARYPYFLSRSWLVNAKHWGTKRRMIVNLFQVKNRATRPVPTAAAGGAIVTEDENHWSAPPVHQGRKTPELQTFRNVSYSRLRQLAWPCQIFPCDLALDTLFIYFFLFLSCFMWAP